MYLIVISQKDPASLNISEHLLELGTWEPLEKMHFDGNPVYAQSTSAILVTIDQYHLYFDNISSEVTKALVDHGLDTTIDTVIFASKHKSASGMKTLTVHPIGNFNKAAYGGKPGELVPAAPKVMTMAYRFLNEYAKNNGLEHSVTFEATHHGPYLDTPAFFIEIGSDAASWENAKAGEVIAQTIQRTINTETSKADDDEVVVVGVGGGHYAPRHTDVARKKCVAFGHIIPSYAIPDLSEPVLERVLACTPGVTNVYFHRKALKKAQYRDLNSWFETKGYPGISSGILKDRE